MCLDSGSNTDGICPLFYNSVSKSKCFFGGQTRCIQSELSWWMKSSAVRTQGITTVQEEKVGGTVGSCSREHYGIRDPGSRRTMNT